MIWNKPWVWVAVLLIFANNSDGVKIPINYCICSYNFWFLLNSFIYLFGVHLFIYYSLNGKKVSENTVYVVLGVKEEHVKF